jgi:hypothetical protein
MGFCHQSDYALHPPGGSSVPGKIDANIYLQMPPKELKLLIQQEQDPEEKKKMISALKQYERQYVYPGYPFRSPRQAGRRVLNNFRMRCSEIMNPAINLPVYQDSETEQGQEEIIDGLKGLYDNDNNERFDYARQGLRPLRDIDTAEGGFLNPKESPMGPAVKEKGDGPDPEGMDYADPPTGGDNFDDVFKY